MTTEKGKRVGAILGANKEEGVRFLGFGVYKGDFKLPKEALGFNFGQKNPKIKLDSGEVVYGCECWWGSEKAIKERLKSYKKQGYKIVNVSINKIRKEQKKEQENE